MKSTIKLETLEFSQKKLIKLKLKLPHIVLIDYLHQFFSSGSAQFIVGNKKDTYFYITLNKILSDMPILNIKKRRLQEIILDLVNVNIIKRFFEKSSPKTYIKLNLKPII